MVTISFNNKPKEVKKVEAAKPAVKVEATKPVVKEEAKKEVAKKPSELQRLNIIERKLAALEAKILAKKK